MTAMASHDRREWKNAANDISDLDQHVTSRDLAEFHFDSAQMTGFTVSPPVVLYEERQPLFPELTLVTSSDADEPWVRALACLPYISTGRLLYVTTLKRAIDIVLATILILMFAIPMLAVAIWIKCDSSGSVLYSQQRVGYGRRDFTMYKFRSMFAGSDHFLANDLELTALYTATWKLANDPRITRSGSFIRKFSIDELPQLWHVLTGEMSIVGPRPYMPHELRDEFGVHAEVITSVHPGLTGLWQVSGRSSLFPVDRIALDERYARTCGARLDLRILIKTIKVVISRHGAC